MKCTFNIGDIVVGVAEEFTTCSNLHPDEDGWDSDVADIGKHFKINAMFKDEHGCILLNFDGRDEDFCSGAFRKVERADSGFIAMLKSRIRENA